MLKNGVAKTILIFFSDSSISLDEELNIKSTNDRYYLDRPQKTSKTEPSSKKN